MFQLPADSALSAFSREGVERLCFFNLVASPDERYFFKDRESRFVLVSDGWLAGVGQGHALEEVVGKTDFDFTGHDQAMIAFQEEQRVITTGEPMVARIDRDWAPGRPDTWLQVVKLPLRDGEGKIVGTWGITRDVTAQVDAERALAASESQYRSLFEHNPQPMMAYARDARQIVAVSSAAVAAYGYTREEFLGMTIDDLIPAEAQPLTGPPSHGFSGATQAHHQYKDGTVIDVEITSDDLTLDGHECRIALCLNVTERNRTTAELAIARDAAVEASNTKSAFLANMSHEIRTPMAGVLGMAELLLDSRLDDDQRELLTHISRSGELLMGLINDVLDLSKIEARQLTLDIADFALRETIPPRRRRSRTLPIDRSDSMTSERLTPAATSVGMRRAIVRRWRHTLPLAIAMLAIFAASAAAHTVAATATCGSVTFNWAIFSASGSGNGGLNTPAWAIVFTPASGAPFVIQGTTSFAGSTSALTVPIPSSDGVVRASSSWTSAETRDGNSSSGSTSLTIANCPPPAVAPAPVTVVPEVIGAAHPVATPNSPGTLALSTNGSAAPTSGDTIRDTAVLSGGSSPTGTITFSLYSASDTTCSSLLRKVSAVSYTHLDVYKRQPGLRVVRRRDLDALRR